MKAPKMPRDEYQRQSALDHLSILDTESEDRFNRISRLAKRLFNVPMAAIAFVDNDRVWVKSSVGFDESSVPREISFCGHTILTKGLFCVEDTAKDERFFDNPLVSAPYNFKFYAGQTLESSSGEHLGTICIMDTVARAMTPDDKTALQDLAALVENELIATKLATTDELTQISNRLGFSRLAEYAIHHAIRQQFRCFLVFVDINNFKRINDNHGHKVGDTALKTIAQQMTANFRRSDICARRSGDEFVILLTHTTLHYAYSTIERFQASLNSYVKQHNIPFDIELACGVSEFDPSKHATLDDLIDSADKEMYINKLESKSLV